jgi:hypothetical protein
MEGTSGATAAGKGRCIVTGLPGERLRLREGPADGSAGGELLRVAVTSALREEAPHPPAPLAVPAIAWARVGEEAEPVPPAPTPEPVSLAELHDRLRGKRFGEKVHRVFEAHPPVTDPWPPPGAPLPVEWGEGEDLRWDRIAAAIPGSRFFRDLLGTRPVGTEIPLLRFRGGDSKEARADLVVRAKEVPGGTQEYWVADYKTGERDRELEGQYLDQVREYREILSEAWGSPVRGFIWYVETGEAVEVS